MGHRISIAVSLVSVLCVAVLVYIGATALGEQASVTQSMGDAIDSILNKIGDVDMQTLVTKWCSLGPDGTGSMEQIVKTPWIEGETAAEHAARHKAAVDALAALFPPK